MRQQDNAIFFEQLEQIAQGLAETFAPFCEVVLHDLRDPQHAILAIHNNLSGREIGEPATELGLARIADPAFPQVIANYSNSFADGRRAKSTSIGIRDSQGKYVAALCLNVDLTLFSNVQSAIAEFTKVDSRQPPLRDAQSHQRRRPSRRDRPICGAQIENPALLAGFGA